MWWCALIFQSVMLTLLCHHPVWLILSYPQSLLFTACSEKSHHWPVILAFLGWQTISVTVQSFPLTTVQLAQGWTRMTSNDIAFGVEQMMSLAAESTVASSWSETSDEQFNCWGLYLHQSALFLRDCKKKIVSLISDRVLLIFPSRFETLDRFQGDYWQGACIALVGSEERTWLSIQEPKGNHTWSCLATRAWLWAHLILHCHHTLELLRRRKQGSNASQLQGSQNRWEPVRFDWLPVKPIRAGIKPAQIQNSNLNSKNEKFLKILQGGTNLMVSNFLKNSFI